MDKTTFLLISLLLSLLLVCCQLSQQCNGATIEIRDQQYLFKDTTITLYNSDEFIVSNSTVYFDNVTFVFGSNVTFSFFSDCHLSSVTPILIEPNRVNATSLDMISTLKLTNITLSMTTTGNFYDFIIDMKDGKSQLMSNKAVVVFTYASLIDGDDIMQGGTVVIVAPETSATLSSISIFPPGFNSIFSPIPSYYLPTITITATIINQRTFTCFFPIKIEPSLMRGNSASCRYFFSDITTASEMGHINFTRCSAILFKVNTRGGRLSFQYSAWDLGYNISAVANTTVHFLENATLVANMISINNPRSPFADGILTCSRQTLSIRMFTEDMLLEPMIWLPTCEVPLFRCFSAGNDCITMADCYGDSIYCNSQVPPSNEAELYPNNAVAASLGTLDTEIYQPFICWNGKCSTVPEKCMPFPACPRNQPVRCSGFCLPANSTCPYCANPCPFGCLNSTQLCNQPWFGCGIGQYQCPNNLACVLDPADCDTYGMTDVPSSNRLLTSTTDVYTGLKSVAAMWFGIASDALNFTAKGQIVFTGSALPETSNFTRAAPIGDSYARLATDDNYTFSEPISIFLENEHVQHYGLDDMCLGFINLNYEWECTPYPLEYRFNKSIIMAQTIQFSNFALLLKYNKAGNSSSTDSSKQEISTKTMIIIATTVCTGVVILTALGAVVLNVGLKKLSPFRRYKVEITDEEKEKYQKQRI
ncbi:hypothetical protein DFA_00877 [Cavenderia fasciculata]|uniref:Uncharacterized protein n=1 Tax=Cavenderia fasciculata TaxID=261658 RepID=F4PUD6_CACFS|nr:uncharacterized protein DFA_00877 [Cavenderia fasciculata]EGG21008.1 hypothetical protein DFA_00877 [Cavenderia fasciculata]|eukprot:XP_004358858.1 hypothetical protein DFA_00877 [Cavenderia fasciculata]